MRRDYKRKCPIAVNDKFCSGAIRNQLESSIASRVAHQSSTGMRRRRSLYEN